MSVDVRAVTESEFPDWQRALRTGFLNPPVVTDAEVADRLPHVDLARTLGAYDRGRTVATFRSFRQEVSTVGGGSLTADAITQVTVAPTHRRRGLLSRMMGADLAAARERGDAIATLIAAEYPIYGRFGFGPASSTAEWSVDVRRAGLDPRRSGRPGDGGRIDLTDADEIRKVGPEVYARLARVRAGVTDRTPRGWDVGTGRGVSNEPWREPYYAIYRAESGEVEGYVAYTADDKWDDAKQPMNTATVRDLIAVTPAAERALWHFLCSIDWIGTVRSGYRAPDDPLPLLLPDPRAAKLLTYADMLWVRVLDPVRVLESRAYPVADGLVLDLRDGDGFAGGRYRLDASPDGVSCARTDASADLAFDIAELGVLAFGDESAVRLGRLGRVEELTAGAAARADLLFRTPLRPFSPDIF
ncbi:MULTISPECIES: GNAT family N-acetyltransferase [Streptomyces]|uniref:Enhanced intracellular survival protein n=1 Tax=Streptomyces venezuelae (strain ATCC 10712 / CBS 650.69 / DSM 40230 / JCM 4526 / NBRC 13096 / PD 04745) TaxID=953739 RepID=F2RFR8_STRVP|nr:GNAT family N-acetyltransferase [Streptomyces venezuelae]APE22959.1 GNAT family N-acetyltransferase [Streptomyces venezuelae]QES00338.1 GNAT family N-acetyltransferase [Streptomyces venezuelae ATCC 10712]CCA57220.1 Enhanced intracellular survival protein [Streptomyces venezuelae ATCC 10712]